MHRKINFSSPNISIREYFSVAKVLSSGWLTTGKRTNQFESKVKDYIGLNNNAHAIAVNSATAGLHLALEARVEGERVVVADDLALGALDQDAVLGRAERDQVALQLRLRLRRRLRVVI